MSTETKTAALSAQEAAIESGKKVLHGTVSDRVLRMFEAIRSYGPPRLTLERAVLFTESFKTTEARPLVLRWAKALKNIAEKISVAIFDDELIVGRPSTWFGRYSLVYPELDGTIMKAGAEAFIAAKGAPNAITVTEEDKKTIDEVLFPYWNGKDVCLNFIKALPPESRHMSFGSDPNNVGVSQTFVIVSSSTMRSSQNWVIDFEKMLKRGCKGMREEAQAKLAALEHPRDIAYKGPFYEAAIITCDALSLFAKRFSQLRHLYGQVYNVVVGQTWSTFVDPDAFPDTVDYELANSSVLTRLPLVRYIQPLNEQWQLNFGLEQPDSKVDAAGSGGSAKDRAPDFGANVRWERAGLGHVQLSGVARVLGLSGGSSGSQEVFGGGLNLSGAVRAFGRDNVIGQLTYGQGIGRYGHDSSAFSTDAALDAGGDLVALPYFGSLVGYTHHWNDRLRSTLAYGYVTVDNQSGQAATAYHHTHYGALNLIWQPFPLKNLSLGLEGLYGVNEVKSGATGDDGRVQLGILYSLF